LENDNNISLPGHWVTYLELLETELGVPILLIDGGYRRETVVSDSGVTLVVNGRSTAGAGQANDWVTISEWPAAVRTTRRAALARANIADSLGYVDSNSAQPLTFGELYGEIMPGTVYYAWFFPYMHEADAAALDLDVLFRQQIEIAISEEFASTTARRASEAGMACYTEFVKRSPEVLLADLRRRVEVSESTASTAIRQHTTALATLRLLHREANAVLASIERSPEDRQRDWEALVAHQRITAVNFATTGELDITTTPIRMHHPDAEESRWLGRFRITLGLGPNSESIKFFNLDNPHNGRPHPHVTSDGVACFGDIGSTVAKYHAEAAIIPLFETLIHYLESFNPEDDYGLHAAWWFDLPDAEPQEAVTA
jgi:hypothetical protein